VDNALVKVATDDSRPPVALTNDPKVCAVKTLAGERGGEDPHRQAGFAVCANGILESKAAVARSRTPGHRHHAQLGHGQKGSCVAGGREVNALASSSHDVHGRREEREFNIDYFVARHDYRAAARRGQQARSAVRRAKRTRAEHARFQIRQRARLHRARHEVTPPSDDPAQVGASRGCDPNWWRIESYPSAPGIHEDIGAGRKPAPVKCVKRWSTSVPRLCGPENRPI
jgi:hypothetical protein